MSNNIYQENIIDHYTNPKNFKVIKDATYKGKFSNLSCGDEVEVYVTTDSSNNITDIGFQGSGCALSIATTSILSEELKGKSIEYIKALKYEDLTSLIGITPSVARSKCVLTGLEALRDATKK